jgi:hypothetical protein
MTDAQLPPWDNDPLERWEPSSAQRARAYELWTLRAEGSADFPAAAKLGCDSTKPADRQGGENVTRRCASSDDQPCAPIGAGVAVDGLDCVVIASVAGGR